MSRKNNIADMTIREQLKNIYDNFCHEYCKYYGQCKDQIDAIKGDDMTLRSEIIDVCETSLHEHCEECPLSRL